MTDTPTETATLAVVVARLDDLRDQQRRDTEMLTRQIGTLQQALEDQRATFVPRGEWEQRNRLVDDRFDRLDREVGQGRTLHRSDVAVLDQKIEAAEAKADAAENAKRVPWTAVVAAVVSVIALLVSLPPLGM